MTRPLPQLLAEIDALLAKATPGDWQLKTVPTDNGQGSCHQIGPFPSGSSYHKDTWVCIYADGVRIGIDEGFNKVGDELAANAKLLHALHAAYPQLREAAQDRERMREALEELVAERDADVITTEGTAIARAALARKEG